MKRNLVVPTIGLALLLTVGGCGAGTAHDNPAEEISGQVAATTPEPAEHFDFSVDSVSTDSDMKLSFPKEIIETAPDAQSLLIESVVVKARKLRLPSVCAIDFAITYADGGMEALRDLAQKDDPTSEPERANEIPHLRNFTSNLTDGEQSFGFTIESLNEIAPEDGVYFSPDLKTMTRVESCVEASSDYSDTFIFPYVRADNGELYLDQFAEVGLNATAGGTVTVIGEYVDGFEIDSSGKWSRP